MNGTFRPHEKLVEITVLGRPFLVPEKNTLLRCFQYLSPGTIPYARFCWDQECEHCRVTLQLPDEDGEREAASCQFLASAGLSVTALAPELQMCLEAKLGVREPNCPETADMSS